MDAELKAKWVAALRGGAFPQGKFQLHSAGRYCCLGVLCVIAGHSTNVLGDVSYPGDINIDVGLSHDICQQLAYMNDGESDWSGKSFTEIADYIEANL